MADYQASDLGTVCAAVALVSINLARSNCVGSCLRAMQNLGTRVNQLFTLVARTHEEAAEISAGSGDQVSEEVARLMKERRKKYMKMCCMITCHILSIVLVAIVSNILRDSPRWLSFEQTITLIVLFVLALVFNSESCLDDDVTIYASYMILMIMSMVWVFGGDLSGEERASNGEVILNTFVAPKAFRLFATVSVLHFRVALSWNVVGIIVSCCKLAFAEPGHTLVFFNMVAFEVISCIALLLLSEGIRSATSAELYHMAKAAAGSIEQSAATTLLEIVCDIFLPLDSTLTISEDAPRFKAMLMLNPNVSVKGVQLENYVTSEEDKAHLQRQLTSSSPGGGESSVRCFNVTMRDSDGNGIRVEMFSVAFETLNRSRSYMLGIREFSDLAPLRRAVELRQQEEALETDSRQNEDAESSQRGEDGAPSRDGTRDATRASPETCGEVVGRPLQTHDEDSNHGFSTTRDVQGVVHGQLDASSSEDDAAVRAPLGATASPAIHVQDLKYTSEDAKVATTVKLIKSWKIESRNWCCEMHAAVPEVQRIWKIVRNADCMVMREDVDEQCGGCGVFQDYGTSDTCKLCGIVRRLRL